MYERAIQTCDTIDTMVPWISFNLPQSYPFITPNIRVSSYFKSRAQRSIWPSSRRLKPVDSSWTHCKLPLGKHCSSLLCPGPPEVKGCLEERQWWQMFGMRAQGILSLPGIRHLERTTKESVSCRVPKVPCYALSLVYFATNLPAPSSPVTAPHVQYTYLFTFVFSPARKILRSLRWGALIFSSLCLSLVSSRADGARQFALELFVGSC